jgi:stage II sporulation protein D
MRFLKVILLVTLAATYYLLPAAFCSVTSDTVRVRILADAKTFGLKIDGRYELKNPADKTVLYRGKDIHTTVTAHPGGIMISGKNFPVDRLFISTKDGLILINGRAFRGDVQIIRNSSSLMSVVNYIGLEDYVKGILYHEVSHYWPMEVLKAQAIVSRSYARYQMKENTTQDYDLTNDVYSQVYGGSVSERQRTNRAVDLTAGKILIYGGAVMPAFFHATCGGRTEDASRLWNVNIPPLKGAPCDFCREAPHFRWHEVMFTGELRQRLVNSGKSLGVIKDIRILGRDESGRITELQVVSSNGSPVMSAKDFRNIVGPNSVRSVNFTVSIVGTDAVFEGLGWGHGVGLCQWGAYFMSKQGYSADKILQYYYPGSDVKAR